MRCPKCGGKLHHEMGAFNVPEHIHCLNCGQYWERRREVVMRDLPVVEKRPAFADSEAFGPCGVAGCARRINVYNNKSGLCVAHQNQLRIWEGTRQLTPAPLIRQGDGWIENPERKPAKPKRPRRQHVLTMRASSPAPPPAIGRVEK